MLSSRVPVIHEARNIRNSLRQRGHFHHDRRTPKRPKPGSYSTEFWISFWWDTVHLVTYRSVMPKKIFNASLIDEWCARKSNKAENEHRLLRRFWRPNLGICWHWMMTLGCSTGTSHSVNGKNSKNCVQRVHETAKMVEYLSFSGHREVDLFQPENGPKIEKRGEYDTQGSRVITDLSTN